MMKKAFIWLIVIVLILVGSVWGALMYLTDEVTKTNTMTIGNVGIELLEFERENIETSGDAAKVQNFHEGKWLLPAIIASDFTYTAGDTCVKWDKDKDGNTIKPGYTSPIWDPADINNEIDKMVFVKNTGKRDAYVRVFFAFEAGNYTDFDDFRNNIHLNLNDDDWTWEWIKFIGESDDANYFVAKATYKNKLAPGAITEISLSQIALDSAAENDDVAAFDGKYDVKVCAQGIQSEGFDTAAQALTEGFGRGIPFNDIYIEGATMKNALRYLDGDTEGENITNKVTSITFGLNNAYPQIADNYQGTPINDEQDYYVNVHYVPQGENYNLYVLADGPIYTPVDSTDLFYKMQCVETINMDNLNTSRTQNMSWMLGDCRKLSKLDLSKWDVRNVTNMNGLLYMCTSLTEISFDGWETENLVYLSNFLRDCSSLKKADVSDLDTKKVKTLYRTFYGCGALEEIEGLNEWNTSKVENMEQVFLCREGDPNPMTEIDISNFDSSSVTVTSYMFYYCSNLETVHFGEKWDMAKVSNTNNMFNGCTSLQTINVAVDWNTQKLTNVAAMFKGCTKLIGGKGTVFNSANNFKEYARIDNPPDAPGYLTYKPSDSTNP